MSRLDFSSAHQHVASGAGADFTSPNQYPDGIAGIYPYADGSIDFIDSRGVVHTGVPVFGGLSPSIRGKINITANTVDLLIGLG
jgi:hypothetical protein